MYSLSSLILAGSVAKSSAFVSPHTLITKPCHGIINPNNNILYSEEEDNGGSSINLDTFISSFPSPEDLKENILEVSSVYQEHYITSSINLFLLISYLD